MSVSSRPPTVAVSAKAKELKAAGYNIANLGSGEPDFDTPQHIKDAATAAIAGGMTKYTAVDGTPELKKAIAEKFRRENSLDCSPKQIIVSAGAKHSLMNLMLAVLGPGDEVVIPAPYWVSYPDMSLLADATPVVILPAPNNNTKSPPPNLAKYYPKKPKWWFLTAPPIPPALYILRRTGGVRKYFTRLSQDRYCSDDIYEHIRYKGRPFANILNSCPDLAERTVIINGVSKAYAMTGWRIGYAAGPEKIIRAMTKIQSQMTTNPCSIAQAAAQAALEGGNECITPMLVAFDRRRRFMEKGLNDITGLNCPPIEGAFYAFPMPEKQ